jgi:cell division protein FtsI (penicillin-binding protein 3)
MRPGGGFRPRVRLIFLLACLVLAFVLIAGRLVWVQGLNSSRYVALASLQRDRTLTLPATRGEILDRNGQVLAMSVDAKTVIADPHQISDPKAESLALAPLLGVPAGTLAATLSNGSGYAYLARQIDPHLAARVMALRLPGITDIDEPQRVYPDGQLAAHVLGFLGGTRGRGLAGLESVYNGLLAGRAGQEQIQADPQGQEIVSAHSQVIPPVQGSDLILTLDQDIQYEAETALAQAMQSYKARAGSIVVMDPATGNVLALANAPTFDPGNFATATAQDLTDRAVSDVYEPGSTNKVITASAALESGAVTTQTVVTVPNSIYVNGSRFHDAETHGTLELTLPQILEQSSNVGTIRIAMQVGAPRMDDYLQKFGYGKPTGIGLPGESGGILPSLANWSGTTLPTAAIGQGVALTVMQMMSVYSTVANGGVRVTPRIVAATRDAAGRLRPVKRATPHRVIQAATASTITSMLLNVVNGSTGTGALAQIPGYEVAGKTGTAEHVVNGAYSGYIASFMGFAPAANPRLVVGVVLDNPTPIWGGSTAAPTFKTVMQFALQRLGIGPGPVLSPLEGVGGTPLPTPARSGDVPPGPPAPAPSGASSPAASNTAH